MFLRDVSIDLLKRFGNNLSKVTVVFPGKRAKLFMNQYLAEESERPVWAPQYVTIDELVHKMSTYRKADTITSVCQLYNIYSRLIPDAEPLDEFYNWGEVILSDFDDIDKHMAPADKIFRNVYDIHAISTDYLTDKQVEALREFFHNFDKESNSELKQRFLRLWDIMPDLYTQLRSELSDKGLLYAGALYRDVAERLKRGDASSDAEAALTNGMSSHEGCAYVFVGFNILDESTETIFRHFQQEHKALFYWDYDQLWTKDDKWEAGLFISQDLRLFPNALGEEYFDNLKNLKDLTFIATSTNNAQSRYIPTWIDSYLTQTENETAIVLADEHQLGSVLHSIPENAPHSINVTMGYPLSDTPVLSFLNVVMSLFIDGFDTATGHYRQTALDRVRRHPFYNYCGKEMFKPEECNSEQLLERLIGIVDAVSHHYALKNQSDIYDQLYCEALFQTHLTLTRFLQLTQADVLNVNPFTLRRLLWQIFSATSIPFHGEPAIGMQVMGLLETRNIDFRNLLMLNVGEGILPKRSDDISLIPHNLRESFGLTTIRHRISVFAYYFYRLISRAEHVTLMFNENTVGATANEMSRFMRQLMAETDIPINYIRLTPSNAPEDGETQNEVFKTPEIVDSLRRKYINNEAKSLSPTAINTYLNCSLQFYYKYVAGIFVEDKPEDGITPALFGTIFHDSAWLFYTHIMHDYGTQVINADMLGKVLSSPDTQLYPFTDISLILNYFNPIEDEKKREIEMTRLAQMSMTEIRQIVADFFGKTENATLLTGLTHIIHGVLRQYLLHLIQYDKIHAPFTIEALEQEHFYRLEVNPGEFIRTGGRIDRLERDTQGRLTVVDYKTGGHAEPIKDVEEIIKHEKKNAGYFLQTFLYAMAVQQEGHNPDSPIPAEAVCPTLFYINRANRPKKYERTLHIGTVAKNEPVNDVSPYVEEFTKRLSTALRDLFSPDKPFRASTYEKACIYCDFKQLCNK